MWFWVLVVVLAIAAITVLLVGSGSTLSEVYEDRPDRTIPVGRPLTADDLSEIRFTTAMRGYRMDEVDALIDRLRADLLGREAAGTRTQAPRRVLEPVFEGDGAPQRVVEPVVEEDEAPDTDVEVTEPIPVVGAEQTDPALGESNHPGGSTVHE